MAGEGVFSAFGGIFDAGEVEALGGEFANGVVVETATVGEEVPVAGGHGTGDDLVFEIDAGAVEGLGLGVAGVGGKGEAEDCAVHIGLVGAGGNFVTWFRFFGGIDFGGLGCVQFSVDILLHTVDEVGLVVLAFLDEFCDAFGAGFGDIGEALSIAGLAGGSGSGAVLGLSGEREGTVTFDFGIVHSSYGAVGWPFECRRKGYANNHYERRYCNLLQGLGNG